MLVFKATFVIQANCCQIRDISSCRRHMRLTRCLGYIVYEYVAHYDSFMGQRLGSHACQLPNNAKKKCVRSVRTGNLFRHQLGRFLASSLHQHSFSGMNAHHLTTCLSQAIYFTAPSLRRLCHLFSSAPDVSPSAIFCFIWSVTFCRAKETPYGLIQGEDVKEKPETGCSQM